MSAFKDAIPTNEADVAPFPRPCAEPEVTGPPPLPRQGEIILAYAPRYDAPDRPGIHPIPCLVIAAREGREGQPGEIALVRGSIRNLERAYRGELMIDSFDSLAASGLRGATKFDLRAPFAMPWTPEWYHTRQGTARIGELGPRDLARAASAQADAVRAIPGLAALPPIVAPAPGLPRPGEVVMAYPSHHETPGQPGAFARPCLVIEAGTRPGLDGTPEPVVRLVASTNSIDRAGMLDLVIAEDAGMRSAGLNAPRRFAMANAQEMPWQPQYLSYPNGSATLGRLSPTDHSRAVQAYGRACNACKGLDQPGLPDNPDMLPSSPEPGDVLYAYCPYEGAPNVPGPKPRPCVVLSTREVTGPRGVERALLVAPVTSQKIYAPRPGDLVVENEVVMAACGLTKPSKVRFGQPEVIRWNQSYLCFRDGGPKLGRMPEREMEQGMSLRPSSGRPVPRMACAR